jgi:hypothetical protein
MLAPTCRSDLRVVFVGVEVAVARSRVELFEQIRRDRRVEGLSIRELAERHRVHRRTVRQALASALRRFGSRPPPSRSSTLGGSSLEDP